MGSVELALSLLSRGEGDPQLRRVAKNLEIAVLDTDTTNLLGYFAPPAVIVNEKGDVVYISGRTGKYLEPAAGNH